MCGTSFQRKIDWRTMTSDRTAYNNSSLSTSFELVGVTSLDRNYQEATNLSFVLPVLHLNIRECCNLGQKVLDVHDNVVPAQEVNNSLHCIAIHYTLQLYFTLLKRITGESVSINRNRSASSSTKTVRVVLIGIPNE